MVWQEWERLTKQWGNALAQCCGDGGGGHLPASAWGLPPTLCTGGSHSAKARGLAASTLDTLVPCWAVLSTQAAALRHPVPVPSPVLEVPPSPQGNLTQGSHAGKAGGSPGTGRVPTPAVCYSQAHTAQTPSATRSEDSDIRQVSAALAGGWGRGQPQGHGALTRMT